MVSKKEGKQKIPFLKIEILDKEEKIFCQYFLLKTERWEKSSPWVKL